MKEEQMASNNWEQRFDEWWKNHDDIMGGLSSNLVPNLKSFFSLELDKAREEGFNAGKLLGIKDIVAQARTEGIEQGRREVKTEIGKAEGLALFDMVREVEKSRILQIVEELKADPDYITGSYNQARFVKELLKRIQ